MLMIILSLVFMVLFLLALTYLCEGKGEKALIGFLIAWFGFNVGGRLIEIIQEPYTNRQAVEECQKDLPRSQKCVLIAVPAESKGE